MAADAAGLQGSEPHRCAARGPARRAAAARVASAFDLWSAASRPAAWAFPVEGARDLSAQLDGRDVPVRVAPGAATATVEVAGTGPHRLVVRRLGALADDRRGRTSVCRCRRWPWPVSRRGRRGGTRSRSRRRGGTVARDGILEAALGPVEALDVRWSTREMIGPPAPRG